jgi:outer membrane protein OmpA-like peptidoglycan-associated protein
MKRIYRIAIASCIIGLFPAAGFPHILKWNMEKDDRIEIVKTASVQLLVNKRTEKVYEERNIIDLTCLGRDDDGIHVKGVFSIFSRDQGIVIFKAIKKDFSEFSIQPDGRFVVSKEYLMPNLRHIPTFPKTDLKVGDTWEFPGELVLDHLSRPFSLQFPVIYKLREVKNQDGRNVAVIQYQFEINLDMSKQKLPDDFPLAIAGQNSGLLLWDIDGMRPIDGKDSYRIIFLQPDGTTTVEFRMNIATDHKVYAAVKPEDKEQAKQELSKELGDKKGITVDTDDRGIVLRMGEVLFDFDSDRLRDDTRKTLDAVVDAVKKKYPDREIIVEGHTDSTGDRQYNQGLSERRASSVAGYMKKGVGHDKFSYRGFGPEKPIADNNTKDGRAKNRRVDIIIKLK